MDDEPAELKGNWMHGRKGKGGWRKWKGLEQLHKKSVNSPDTGMMSLTEGSLAPPKRGEG
jgi:hypothetical protein